MSTSNINLSSFSRRQFLKTGGMTLAGTSLSGITSETLRAAPKKPGETYDTHVNDIRIVPGVWRPHYPWEHIAWVSPSWASQDYLWLDFPEAIFTSQGLLYLSHVNPLVHTVYDSHLAVPWKTIKEGISFERLLPNGVSFGSEVTKHSENIVDLKIWIKNGSQEPLKKMRLQTCAFLRGIKEFAEYTTENKFVHTKQAGWIPYSKVHQHEATEQNYHVGWGSSGKRVADMPVMVTVSNAAERLVAMTWYDKTHWLVCNPRHPCFHADPFFPDLEPGGAGSIHGQLIFFEGTLDEFDFSKYLK